MKQLSKRGGARFGKPGRPAKDGVGERVRIYRAAGPLILERGVRGTTIAAVARTACLSPGGIYHYFPSKRRLLLYGLEPEALSRACRDESADLERVLASGPSARLSDVIELYVDKSVRMLEFVRPALHAAIELGRPELRKRLSAGLKEDADFLITALTPLATAAAGAAASADAVRRTTLGLALDESVTREQMRRQLLWLFGRLFPGVAAGVSDPARSRRTRDRPGVLRRLS